MTDTAEMIRIILQLVFGIAALLWYPFEIVYRKYHSSRLHVGFWDIETPLWHKIAFWPIILVLFLLFTWALFF
jgi:hypothetical protein